MLTVTCPRCRAEVTLPPRRLLVRGDDADPTGPGELLFTCLGCHGTAVLALDAPAVAALTERGVTYLSLPEPVARPEG